MKFFLSIIEFLLVKCKVGWLPNETVCGHETTNLAIAVSTVRQKMDHKEEYTQDKRNGSLNAGVRSNSGVRCVRTHACDWSDQSRRQNAWTSLIPSAQMKSMWVLSHKWALWEFGFQHYISYVQVLRSSKCPSLLGLIQRHFCRP